MNQYQEFNTPLTKNAAYFRREARTSLKNNYLIAVLVGFLMLLLTGSLPSIVSGAFSVRLPALQIPVTATPDEIPILLDAYGKSLTPYIPNLIFSSTIATLLSVGISLFFGAPINVGYQRFNLALVDKKVEDTSSVSLLFSCFQKDIYLNTVLLQLLYSLISLLAAIPTVVCTVFGFVILFASFATLNLGAIVGGLLLLLLFLLIGLILTCVLNVFLCYGFAFAPMILGEYPSVGVMGALRSSYNLMRGKKFKLFCLDLSFIGWFLLATCCTCGLGMILIIPYQQAARAHFYHAFARREEANNVDFPSIDPDDYVTD